MSAEHGESEWKKFGRLTRLTSLGWIAAAAAGIIIGASLPKLVLAGAVGFSIGMLLEHKDAIASFFGAPKHHAPAAAHAPAHH